jgi:MFS family permease
MDYPKSILRNRSLITLGAAESIGGIGDWITMIAVFAMLVFHSDGGVAQSSGVYLAGLLPMLLTSPLAGWLCDRFDRKWLMVAGLLGSALSVSGLIFTSRLEWIYAILAVQAVLVSILPPARQSLIPDIVSSEDLPRANAFLQQLSSLVKIFAPALAGFVLTIMNPHQAVIFNVLALALAAIIISRLPSLPPHRSSTPRQEPSQTIHRADLRAAFRQSPQLLLLMASLFATIFVIIGFDVLATVYIRDIIHENEQFFGFAIGLLGCGMLLATLWLMTRKGKAHLWRELTAGILLLAAVPVSLALGVSAPPALARWLIMIGCLLGGIGSALVNVQSNTLVQTLAPAEMLGQVSGLVQSSSLAGQLLGVIATPLLVPGLLSMVQYFMISAAVLIVLVAALVVQLALSHKNLPASRMESTGNPG